MIQRKYGRIALLVLSSVGFLGLGCVSAPVVARRPAPRTAALQAEAGFTPAQVAMIQDNCGPLGAPVLDPNYPHGPTEFVIREGYVLEHSSEDKIPRWVCEHVTPQEVAQNSSVSRRDRFAPDPQLTGKPRAELSDYRRSGFDRGHQAPAGNQNSVQRLKDETFFLSNMTPQTGAHNQRIWADLEHMTRDWVGGGVVDSAFIITGGFFYDPEEEDQGTADGMIDYRIIGNGAVAVPTHYFKIIYSQDSSGALRALAFVHENRGYPAPFNHAALIQPIDWIEERSGIDFFPDLDPTEEQRIEGAPGTMFR